MARSSPVSHRPAARPRGFISSPGVGIPRALAKLARGGLLVLAVHAAPATASELFSYRGTLDDAGAPAEGVYDLEIRFFRDALGDDALGPAITLPQVAVKHGEFEVPVELPYALPEDRSVWLQARVKAPDESVYRELIGRQEIKGALAACWATDGNTGLNSGVVGISSGSTGLLNIKNSSSDLYLRANGGIEQDSSTASGPQSVAWNSSTAAGVNSFTAGRGVTGSTHSYSTVFADAQPGTFASSAENQFLIRAQNHVGINTTTPHAPLTVRRGGSPGVTSVEATIVAESDSHAFITLMSAIGSTALHFGRPGGEAAGRIAYNDSLTGPDSFTFFTVNEPRMRLYSQGELLVEGGVRGGRDIGNLSFGPQDDLEPTALMIKTPGNVPLGLSLRNDGTGFLRGQINGSTSGQLMSFSNGKVGILQLAGTNTLEVGGTASKATAGSWLANSDRRIKRDIEPVHDALATLRRVPMVTFRYTPEYLAAHPRIADTRYWNVIAQDFAQVFPDAVKGSGEYLPGHPKTAENEILQVDTYPATITAIAALLELDATVSLQADRMATLERENRALKSRLERLERLLDTGR